MCKSVRELDGKERTVENDHMIMVIDMGRVPHINEFVLGIEIRYCYDQSF